MASALTKATEIARDESKQPNKFLYLITDSTRSAFEGPQAEALKGAARDAAAVFGDADHVGVYSLGRPDQWNQAVLDLRPGGKYLAKDVYENGGVAVIIRALLASGHLHDVPTVTGRRLSEADAAVLAGNTGGIAHFGFRLADPRDIDDAIAEVERAGGRLLRRGEFAPGFPYAYVADPDGYEIEIWFE